jgi:hypothetical protein
MNHLESHESASIFPLMDGAEYEDLKADIAAHGLREPITLHEGKILDGRNRYRACIELGIKPRFREWERDGSPFDFVISLNLHRRHLSESQRAMVAEKLMPQLEAEARERQSTSGPGILGGKPLPANLPEGVDNQKGEAREKAAEKLNVSPRSVAAAGKVRKQGVPELVKAVETGQASVAAAAEVARLEPEKQKKVVASGKKAIVEAAKNIRKQRKPRKQAPATPRPPSADAECHRMLGIFYEVLEQIRGAGGITAFTCNWEPRQKKALFLQWEKDRHQLDCFLRELEEEVTSCQH